MRYIALIYSNESEDAQRSDEAQQQNMGAFWAYTQQAQEAGIMRSGEALHGTTGAKSVRVRDGKALTTDGPFAETKEQLGGFYIFECGSMEEALSWAAKIPTAAHGTIEVRPLQEIG